MAEMTLLCIVLVVELMVSVAVLVIAVVRYMRAHSDDIEMRVIPLDDVGGNLDLIVRRHGLGGIMSGSIDSSGRLDIVVTALDADAGTCYQIRGAMRDIAEMLESEGSR